MTCLAMVCGCSGLSFTPDELAFIDEAQPWGLILFKRNIDTPDQVRRLTGGFRHQVGRSDAPVLIDQEGGRVQRMGPPFWRKYPAAASYFRLAKENVAAAVDLARAAARLIAQDLAEVGVSLDCAPVLDVPDSGSHDVIGDRAFASDPRSVAAIGRAFAEGLVAGGIVPVIKHMPGHGRARADSHHGLPIVKTDRAQLEQVDFHPFRSLADLPVAMTAHVVFEAIDPQNPATTSATVIEEIIRKTIGFDGLLVSDDLSMNALSGTLAARARMAAAAGIDILLHCNGKLDEAQAVASEAKSLAGRARERAAAALRAASQPSHAFDLADAAAMLEGALAAA